MPAALQRVILTGFMGSGKTTIGRLLALHLNVPFLDLDDVITRATARSIPEIFATEGERAFRLHETRALHAALTPPASLVLALGGGAIETPANRDLLAAAPDSVIVYLTAPLADLQARCTLQAADSAATPRPLLADPARLVARFAAREPLYRALAHVIIDTASLAPAEAVAALLKKLPLRT